MTPSEEAFARRAIRRRRLFLGLSIGGLVIAAMLAIVYGVLWWTHPGFPIVPRAVIVLLVLLNARQNLRQYRYAGVLEQLVPPAAP